MYYFTVRFDIPPGKEKSFERFLEKAKTFWLSQPGVREFHVYGDVLIDWPERKIEIGVADRESLERILASEERRELRSEMLTYVKHPVWQLMELKAHGDLEDPVSIAEAQTLR
jgi:hypothetical protein